MDELDTRMRDVLLQLLTERAGLADALEVQMRNVLLQLSFTSNGRTATFDSSGGGTPDYVLVDDDGRAKLGRGDAPHLTFAAAWDAATDDHARAAVLTAATDELAHIRRSHADPTKVEGKDERDRRIIKDGKGFPAHEVAISIRCGVKDVWNARVAVGCDIEFGERPRDGRVLSLPERNAEILLLTRKGLSQREVALRLNIERSAVRYVLARPGPKT